MSCHKTRFCPKGHDKDLLGRDSSRACRECRIQRLRKRRVEHPEKYREYRKQNADRIRESNREWNANNKEKRTAAYRRRKAADPEKHARLSRESALRWYWAHYEKAKEGNRRNGLEWARRNRLKVAERARMRKAQCVKPIPEEFYIMLFESQSGRCAYCSDPLIGKRHLDHVFPIARGGKHEPRNLAWACPQCNISKHDKLYPSEWTGRHQRVA